MTVRDFAASYVKELGTQPVLQRARMERPDGEPDLGPDGYLGQFLTWGNTSKEAMKRILYATFNNYQAQFRRGATDIRKKNCRRAWNMADISGAFIGAHPPQQEFQRYLARVPEPASLQVMKVPRYNIRQLGELTDVKGMSARQLRAKTRGFDRMLRLHASMAHIKFLHEELDAAKKQLEDNFGRVDDNSFTFGEVMNVIQALSENNRVIAYLFGAMLQ